MTFKDDITTDLGVFINTDEYAKIVTISGEAVNAVVILDDLTPELAPDAHQGTLYVKTSDLSSAPTNRAEVVIDGETWHVYRDARDNAYYESDGLYIIPIIKNEKPGFL